jgi:hypothetical protein
METNREFLMGLGAEKRGEWFEAFLARHGQADADIIFAPLGDGTFTGIARGSESVQVCVRSQKAADVLNAQMGRPPKAFGEMNEKLSDEVGRRLDALAPNLERGKARAAAEVDVDLYTGPRTLTEVSKEPKPGDLVRSDLTTPERHVISPYKHDKKGNLVLDEKGEPILDKELMPKDPAEKKEWLGARQLPADTSGRQGPHPGSRAHDAEAKVLERVSEQVFDDAVGTVHLKTSHPPCPSCIEAIHRFRAKHKGVQVVLY